MRTAGTTQKCTFSALFRENARRRLDAETFKKHIGTGRQLVHTLNTKLNFLYKNERVMKESEYKEVRSRACLEELEGVLCDVIKVHNLKHMFPS